MATNPIISLWAPTMPKQVRTFRMVEVLPRLFISNWPSSIPGNTTHVLTISTKGLHPTLIKGKQYCHIPFRNQDNITPHIPSILFFVCCCLGDILNKNNVVLVHSREGLNRSAAAVLVYLCYITRQNAADTFMILYNRKMDICPRRMFLEQIDGYFKHKGDHVDGDVSREVCNRVEKLRLGWMLKGGKCGYSLDWVWMQKGGPSKDADPVAVVDVNDDNVDDTAVAAGNA